MTEEECMNADPDQLSRAHEERVALQIRKDEEAGINGEATSLTREEVGKKMEDYGPEPEGIKHQARDPLVSVLQGLNSVSPSVLII
jgi:hypothetical protein